MGEVNARQTYSVSTTDGGVMNARWFGNDRLDHTNAIRSALLAAQEGREFGRVAIYLPAGTWYLSEPIEYFGAGEALVILGDGGGILSQGGTEIRWVGDPGETMLKISGVWRGRMEGVDFNANRIAGTAIHVFSDQRDARGNSPGRGFQNYEFSHVGAYDVNHESEDPVVFRVGYELEGVTHQCDLTTWNGCKFRGNYAHPQGTTLVKFMQGGNTKDFCFRDCRFTEGQYGVDALHGSGTLKFDNCHWASFDDGDDGSDAAMVRLSGAVRCNITSPSVENGNMKARFVSCPSMGSTGNNGLKIDSGCIEMDLPDDKVIFEYQGQTKFDNVCWKGAVLDVDNFRPKFRVGARIVGKEGSSALPPTTFISDNCHYGHAELGASVPVYDYQGNALTGPDSLTHYGLQRMQVYSRGDMATVQGGGPIALEPWAGTQPNGGAKNTKAWTPGVIANGSAATTSHAWTIAGTVAVGDHIDAVWSAALSAGVILSAHVIAANQVCATLLNVSGQEQTIAAGTVTFQARRMS